MKKPNAGDAPRRKGGSGGARALPVAATVLHVDDDPNDTELLRSALRKANLPLSLYNVEDGEQAIEYLTGAGVYADRKRYPWPALILLDLKMPRVTGFEVLNWIRAHRALAQVPVIVLSGSALEDDIRQAYEVGATSYMVKPLGFQALVKLVKDLKTSWLDATVVSR
jgi:CheY-like chemotaxis protein